MQQAHQNWLKKNALADSECDADKLDIDKLKNVETNSSNL